MSLSRNYSILVIGSVVLMLFLAIGGLFIIRSAEHSRAPLPVLGMTPEFNALKQDGKLFSHHELLGKLTVVDFIFTGCRDACPIMSTNMADLYQQYKGNQEVQFVSISVDPARDSLSVLQKYADSFGVDNDQWVFLRLPIDEVIKLSETGFMISASDLPEGHSSKFVLLDKEARIRAYYDGLDAASLKKLITDINQLSKTS
jgi:protein SCO1